jgi:predicted cobalt transporter CbtA
MKPSAKSLMWLVGAISAISIALQFVDLFLPFRILALVVLVLTAIIGAGVKTFDETKSEA